MKYIKLFETFQIEDYVKYKGDNSGEYYIIKSIEPNYRGRLLNPKTKAIKHESFYKLDHLTDIEIDSVKYNI